MPCMDSYKRMRVRFWQSYMQNKTVVLREDKIGENPIFFLYKSTGRGEGGYYSERIILWLLLCVYTVQL